MKHTTKLVLNLFIGKFLEICPMECLPDTMRFMHENSPKSVAQSEEKLIEMLAIIVEEAKDPYKHVRCCDAPVAVQTVIESQSAESMKIELIREITCEIVKDFQGIDAAHDLYHMILRLQRQMNYNHN